ncbi:hypothetical protein DL96DRAFT_1824396 [Flagelloscypha sp. PMI_526]|nr:hypothetical protein DL96DRAFT_1824396 [Flagelloscypha sp. PMI_526]
MSHLESFETPSLPDELVDLILSMVTDRRSLKQLTLVSRSNCTLADKTLFYSLIIRKPAPPIGKIPGMALAIALTNDNASPRVIGWRGLLIHFSIEAGGPLQVATILLILRLCPNISSLELIGHLPVELYDIARPALTRLKCLFPYQRPELSRLLSSLLISNITTLQPLNIKLISPSMNEIFFQKLPRLTELALLGLKFSHDEPVHPLFRLRSWLSDSFELLIVSVTTVEFAEKIPIFQKLLLGQVDRRFIACIPVSPDEPDPRWKWALKACIFEVGSAWRPETKDFWQEARFLRDARNAALRL